MNAIYGKFLYGHYASEVEGAYEMTPLVEIAAHRNEKALSRLAAKEAPEGPLIKAIFGALSTFKAGEVRIFKVLEVCHPKKCRLIAFQVHSSAAFGTSPNHMLRDHLPAIPALLLAWVDAVLIFGRQLRQCRPQTHFAMQY